MTLDPDSFLGTDDEVLLHEVTFPPLSEDVSYARFPEDANTADTFVFTQTGTFGTCQGFTVPVCVGAPNTGPDSIPPDIEIMDYTTNSPAAGEAVTFRVRIVDEVSPMEANFNFVELRYHVDTDPSDEDFGVEQIVPMTFLAFVAEPDPPDDPTLPVPKRCGSLREWSIWEGAIPGQAAGAVVRFAVFCQDVDDHVDADPNVDRVEVSPGQFELVHCPLGVGSCDVDDMGQPVLGPGPGCDGDGVPDDCNALFRYTVGSTYSGTVSINEVVPNNDTLEDAVDQTDTCDTVINPNCRNEDFVELCNSSSTDNESLVGYVLTSRPFRLERGWVFETGSEIRPLEHLMVWIDNDGEDPDPLAMPPDPPNPNNPAAGEHHTDFQVDATRDEIFLLDTVANNLQVIDSVRWGVSGRYANSGLHTDDSGNVSINDPIVNLTFQFLGGVIIPPPGTSICGPDPTDDSLDCAAYSREKC